MSLAVLILSIGSLNCPGYGFLDCCFLDITFILSLF